MSSKIFNKIENLNKKVLIFKKKKKYIYFFIKFIFEKTLQNAIEKFENSR